MPTQRVEPGIVHEVVTKVLETMTGSKIAPAVRGARPLGVAAVVGLTGPGVRMAVILHMTRELACRLAGSMLEEPKLQWGRDAEDALAELANVVAGNLKPHVMPGLSLALPTVSCGADLAVSTPRMSQEQSEVYECLGETLVVILARES